MTAHLSTVVLILGLLWIVILLPILLTKIIEDAF